MAPRPPSSDPSDIPVLLRRARGSYGHTMATTLAAAGFDDLPRNGPYVLGGMATYGGSATEIIQSLGVSRQRPASSSTLWSFAGTSTGTSIAKTGVAWTSSSPNAAEPPQ